MSNVSIQNPQPEDVNYKLRGDLADDDSSQAESTAPLDIHRWNVVHRWRGKKLRFWYMLLVAWPGRVLIHPNRIIVLACVSFCFFGYDQGMTAGVNASNRMYDKLGDLLLELTGEDYVKLMGYGYVDEKNEPQVTNGLLEGV
jgi:hypothetical protein